MAKVHNQNLFLKRRRELRERQTICESKMWNFLRGSRFAGYKFKRQHSIGPYIADFYCSKLKLVIEIDGDSHLHSCAKEYDNVRSKFLNGLNIKVLRFTNEEVLNDLENVLNKICLGLPHPTSPYKGEGQFIKCK